MNLDLDLWRGCYLKSLIEEGSMEYDLRMFIGFDYSDYNLNTDKRINICQS